MNVLEMILASRRGRGYIGSVGGGSSYTPAEKYELIETVTQSEDALFDRTVEPIGSAYNFKAIRLKCSGGNSAYNVTFSAYCNSEQIGSVYSATTTGSSSYGAEFKIDRGWWTVRREMNAADTVSQAIYNGGAQWEQTHKADDFPVITRIRSGIIRGGTTIQIWGVRA